MIIVGHICMSCFLMLLVGNIWIAVDQTIFNNGWDLEMCTPIALNELPLFFLPIINVLYTYAALNLMYQLCREKNEEGKVITVNIWKFGIHYTEYN